MVHFDMNSLLGAALLASATLSAGCSTSQEDRIQNELENGTLVIVAEGEQAALKTPATFDYASGSTISVVDMRFDTFAIEADIRGALEDQLAARGLTRKRGKDIDYRIGYAMTSKDQSQITDAVRTMGLPAFRGDAGKELPRGSLLLAIYDTKTEEIVWRAAIEGAIDYSRKKEERTERIGLAISLLLSRLE